MRMAVFVLGLLLMVPALTAMLDTVWWFYTSHPFSSIDWDGLRGFLAYAWAALGFLLWMTLGGL